MSKFRNKAAEIKAAGEAQRGNFEPTGAPKRLYDYWLAESDSKKAEAIRKGTRKENFCHFWRVVAIWAPLQFLKNKAVGAVEHKAFMPMFIALVVLIAIVTPVILGGWEAVFLLLAAIAAVFALLGAGAGLAALSEKYPRQATVVGKWTGIALAAALFVAALVWFISLSGWAGVTLLTIGAVIGGLVYMNVERISDYIHYRRAKREKAEDARRAERDKAREAFLNGTGPNPYEIKVRKPSALERKVRAFFKGIGDFIIMIAQIVRVNKWKICPIVEVDTK